MFTLLMANIQGETLICVSNSDREGTWTQLRLRDSDAVVSPSQVIRMWTCPLSPPSHTQEASQDSVKLRRETLMSDPYKGDG